MVSTRRRYRKVEAAPAKQVLLLTNLWWKVKYNTQIENDTNKISEKAASDRTKHLIPVNSSQVGVQWLEVNFSDRMRSDVNNVVATVVTRVLDAVLTAMDSLIIPKLELAMKLVKALSRRGPASLLFELDQRDFSANLEGFQMTASSKLNENTDINRIDETRCNITAEAGVVGRWKIF